MGTNALQDLIVIWLYIHWGSSTMSFTLGHRDHVCWTATIMNDIVLHFRERARWHWNWVIFGLACRIKCFKKPLFKCFPEHQAFLLTWTELWVAPNYLHAIVCSYSRNVKVQPIFSPKCILVTQLTQKSSILLLLLRSKPHWFEWGLLPGKCSLAGVQPEWLLAMWERRLGKDVLSIPSLCASFKVGIACRTKVPYFRRAQI